MKVICTYAENGDGFTVGKEYEVVCEHSGCDYPYVDVVDDGGIMSYLILDEYVVSSES